MNKEERVRLREQAEKNFTNNNPKVILELLDALDAAEKELEEYTLPVHKALARLMSGR